MLFVAPQAGTWRSLLHGFRFRRGNGNVPDECVCSLKGSKQGCV